MPVRLVVLTVVVIKPVRAVTAATLVLTPAIYTTLGQQAAMRKEVAVDRVAMVGRVEALVADQILDMVNPNRNPLTTIRDIINVTVNFL